MHQCLEVICLSRPRHVVKPPTITVPAVVPDTFTPQTMRGISNVERKHSP
nr:MAG TPA: hypothetical protein [Caudoviricetes sp.]